MFYVSALELGARWLSAAESMFAGSTIRTSHVWMASL